MKTNVERVGPVINLEIEGRPPLVGISYEEALAALDRAYTEEIRETVARMRAMLGMIAGAMQGLETICDELEEEHLNPSDGCAATSPKALRASGEASEEAERDE